MLRLGKLGVAGTGAFKVEFANLAFEHIKGEDSIK